MRNFLVDLSINNKENCFDYSVNRILLYPPQEYSYNLIIINFNPEKDEDFIKFLNNSYPNGIFKRFGYYVLAAFNKAKLCDIF